MEGRGAVVGDSTPWQNRESQRPPFSRPLQSRKGRVSEAAELAEPTDGRDEDVSAPGATQVRSHVANFSCLSGRRPCRSAVRCQLMTHTQVPWRAHYIIVHACATLQGLEWCTSADPARNHQNRDVQRCASVGCGHVSSYRFAGGPAYMWAITGTILFRAWGASARANRDKRAKIAT